MDDADLDLLLALADEAEDDPSMESAQHTSLARRDAPSALAGANASQRGALQHTTCSAPAASRPQATTVQLATRKQGSGRQVSDGYVDGVSGFRVSRPVIGSLVLRERLTDDCIYLGLKDISPSREHTGRWATMAVLVSKAQATGRDGNSYSRWTLSDLAGKQVTLFLWRKAAAEHYKEVEGSLLLLWSPQVRRDEGGGGGGGGAGFSLHVDKPELVQRPGMAADFGLCRGTRKDGQRCTYPINKSQCEYCPYHAQAALRALSSNRSDMAGANLLQRQLLPQARAAQKQMADAYGRPVAGINALIARPPPPPKPHAAPAGLVPGTGAPASAARAPSATRSMASALGGAGGSGTGAYGTSADYEDGSTAGGGAGASSGGKRSYGAQLLASMKERQAADEAGVPAAKRRRSEGDVWDDAKTSSGSASKARAIAAARATGQLTSQQRTGSQPSGSTAAGAAGRQAGAVSASAGSATAGRPPMPVAMPLVKPPPLPPSIAGLLRTGSGAAPASGTGNSSAKPAAPANGPRRQSSGGTTLPATRGASGTGPSFAADKGTAATGPAAGRRASDPGAASSSQQPQPRPEPADEEVELDAEELEIEADPEAVQLGSAARPSGGRDLGPGQQVPEPTSGDEPQLPPGSKDAREVALPLPIGTDGGALPSARQGTGGAAGAGGAGDECGLDELLELFPELQEGQDGAGEADEAVAPEDEGAGGTDQPQRGAKAGSAAAVSRGAAAPSQAAAVSGPVVSAGGSGRALAAAAGAAPATAAQASGLLPRVAGLVAAPAARAAEARKQQAAAAKARAEKLKSIGLKAAAGPPPPPKPLGAANSAAAAQGSGAYCGGGKAPAGSAAAAAAALAAAKGLPQVTGRARSAAAAVPAGTASAPASAMAAAFGSVVQQLPEKAMESRYTELSEDAAGEAVLSMLEGLEARDALVQQLESVTHLKVTAWHCAQCERLYEYIDKQCKADGHTLSKATTLKRFWTCDHCNARVTTLGVRFPASRCSRCNNPSLEFTACSMYRGPRELKPAGMAAASGLACKENLFATLDQHPVMGRRTFR